MDFLEYAKYQIREGKIDAFNTENYDSSQITIQAARAAALIAIAEQLAELNAKVERALALGEIASHCIVDLLPPDDALPPGLCPICPRCDLPGEKCICEEVPGW